MTDTKTTSPLEELRDRLRAKGNTYQQGWIEAKRIADELDKIIEGMCDVALMECEHDWELAQMGHAVCEVHYGHTNDHAFDYIRGTFQPTDNLQPRGE